MNARPEQQVTLMTETEALKNKIVQEINSLSQNKLRELLDFVAHLSDESPSGSVKAAAERELEQDPILKFIGRASHGSLTRQIDCELYDA